MCFTLFSPKKHKNKKKRQGDLKQSSNSCTRHTPREVTERRPLSENRYYATLSVVMSHAAKRNSCILREKGMLGRRETKIILVLRRKSRNIGPHIYYFFFSASYLLLMPHLAITHPTLPIRLSGVVFDDLCTLRHFAARSHTATPPQCPHGCKA